MVNSFSIRVLCFFHETTWSGAPIQLLHLVRWFKSRGWDVSVAVPKPNTPEAGPISDELKQLGIESFAVLDLSGAPDMAELRSLCRLSDIVIANTLVMWAAVQAAHEERIPVIWYIHESLVAQQLIAQIAEIQPALAMADLLVMPTFHTAQGYAAFTDRSIEVVPYGIPEVTAPVNVRPRDPSRVTFLLLGSYELRKGQDLYLEAIAQLPSAARERAIFRSAGRKLDRDFYDALARKAAVLPNVELLDALEHDHACAAISSADVLVCASRDETMPVAILEAMSLGKAVVSTNVGGIAEWLSDGQNALIVPGENSRSLAQAITRCLTEPGLLDALGRNSQKTFQENFSLDPLGKRFTILIERVTENEKPITYAEWIAQYDTVTPEKRVDLRRHVRQLAHQPRISILVPVYNPDLTFLDEAIASVRRQIYENWELCIADDASSDKEVRPYLEEVGRSVQRIKLLFRERNGHISACSNSALTLVSGEWCALLDQDDTLAENALAEVACEIRHHAEAGIIYSDEDFIDSLGVRKNPFFKPDWNPELFMGQNYLNHLGVYRTALLREIGGFREGFEGSQDYDLALRCVARLKPEQIRHLPRILYHWRMVEGSLAAEPDAKTYARHAARRALNSYLRDSGTAAYAEACPENAESHRVIYELSEPLPTVTILVTGNERPYSLKLTDYEPTEVISCEPGAAGANSAARNARGDVLVLLDGEIEVIEPSWLRELVSFVVRPRIGAVGARLWSPADKLEDGGVILGLGGIAAPAFRGYPRGHAGYFNRAWLQQNYSAISGACMVVRKEVFTAVNGFDERNLPRYFYDIDFCLRLRQHGLQIVWTPYANLIFHGSGSRKEARGSDEAIYMHERWEKQLCSDPFYNPNLTLTLPGFMLATSPRLPHQSSRAKSRDHVAR